VQINGGTGTTSLTIDFRAGGLFALPGGIGMEG
jgi:hypothetical protein